MWTSKNDARRLPCTGNSHHRPCPDHPALSKSCRFSLKGDLSDHMMAKYISGAQVAGTTMPDLPQVGVRQRSLCGKARGISPCLRFYLHRHASMAQGAAVWHSMKPCLPGCGNGRCCPCRPRCASAAWWTRQCFPVLTTLIRSCKQLWMRGGTALGAAPARPPSLLLPPCRQMRPGWHLCPWARQQQLQGQAQQQQKQQQAQV